MGWAVAQSGAVALEGLIDAGVTKVPKIFIRSPEEIAEELARRKSTDLQIPVIDISDIVRGSEGREKVVNEIWIASEEWGFFQVVNHGIPQNVLDGMIDGVRMFHDQDPEIKKALYDRAKKVRFETNYDLYRSKFPSWRDTLTIYNLASDQLGPDEVPPVCRYVFIYFKKKNVLKNHDTTCTDSCQQTCLPFDQLCDSKD
ncbi:hypothetical protein RHMOL_Rhmol04G0300600 [Rhododendron molle]|uniref:Uncharacterized protein n=1 Tax=Rhododendron molle TaxID=49168 RepID=A0ACC0P633_RHOML|nr:hypothetical protein RHMOL_Rhmol04G0300600 [Rhododendron molle]